VKILSLVLKSSKYKDSAPGAHRDGAGRRGGRQVLAGREPWED
jgi:hypothetical protein